MRMKRSTLWPSRVDYPVTHPRPVPQRNAHTFSSSMDSIFAMSFDPYLGLGFRLFVDFLFTESIHRLAIVVLWTGLGFVLSDVTPAFWYDKNLRRFYRRTSHYIRHFDWSSLKFPLPADAISRVRFHETPAPSAAPVPTLSRETSPPGPFIRSQR